jgi:hypothetical protein
MSTKIRKRTIKSGVFLLAIGFPALPITIALTILLSRSLLLPIILLAEVCIAALLFRLGIIVEKSGVMWFRSFPRLQKVYRLFTFLRGLW